jgi:tetraacyldisaccharide-1-P 4'-kinase
VVFNQLPEKNPAQEIEPKIEPKIEAPAVAEMSAIPKIKPQRFEMTFVPECFTQLKTGEKLSPADFVCAFSKHALRGHPRQIHVVCGLGHPERFFRTLDLIFKSTSVELVTHVFEDHHKFCAQDFDFIKAFEKPFEKPVASDPSGLPLILMTEKDALKCVNLDEQIQNLVWVLSVQVTIENDFFEALLQAIRV